MVSLIGMTTDVLDGPTFLVFLGLLVASMIGFCWWYRQGIDVTQTTESLPIPSPINPQQIAYLRGGIPELIRLATVDLFTKGILTEKKAVFKKTKWGWKTDQTDLIGLDSIQTEVALYYQIPRLPTDIFRSHVMESLKSHVAPWDSWIEKESLSIPSDKQVGLQWFVFTCCCLVMFLGIGKLIIAIRLGRYNIGFLIGMTLVGTLLIALLGRRRRFSDRGRRYLRDIQSAFSWAQKLPKGKPGVHQPELAPNAHSFGYDLPVLAMGLFGVSALQSSAYSHIHNQYLRSTHTGSGCGGGCGASASIGGGCGGGCGGGGGGCGGGGGGCGGGCGGCGGG